MTTTSNPTKVFWAFDPYSDLKETWLRSAEVIQLLQAKNSYEITPTYFMGHNLVHWINNITPSRLEPVRPIVHKVIKEALISLDITGLEAPELPITNCHSTRGDAEFAAVFFKEKNAELIILNTHATQGLRRLFVGSFAENLLLRSHIPMLFVSPNTTPITKIQKTLIPTDFSSKAFDDFCGFLGSGLNLASEIVLYSKVETPVEAFAQASSTSMGGNWISLSEYVEQSKLFKTAEAKKWTHFLEKKNLGAKVIIDDKPGSLAEGILKTIETEKVDSVSMSSFATQVDAILIGSTAREVLRNTSIPVLVKHFADY